MRTRTTLFALAAAALLAVAVPFTALAAHHDNHAGGPPADAGRPADRAAADDGNATAPKGRSAEDREAFHDARKAALEAFHTRRAELLKDYQAELHAIRENYLAGKQQVLADCRAVVIGDDAGEDAPANDTAAAPDAPEDNATAPADDASTGNETVPADGAAGNETAAGDDTPAGDADANGTAPADDATSDAAGNHTADEGGSDAAATTASAEPRPENLTEEERRAFAHCVRDGLAPLKEDAREGMRKAREDAREAMRDAMKDALREFHEAMREARGARAHPRHA